MSKKKRILLINHYAGSPQMGMEFRPYYLSREWVKMGYRVDIIAADYSHLRNENPQITHDYQSEEIDGIRYHWIHTNKYEGNGIKRAITMAQFVGKLMIGAKRIAKTLKPDVVIASSTYPLDTYAAKKIAKISDAKYIHEVHDMWPATLYEVGGMSRWNPFVLAMQIAENSAYKHCDDLVALLPYSKDYMVQHGLDPMKFHNIQNGVVEEEWSLGVQLPLEHKSFFQKHKDKFIVGYFGGHALSNALDVIIDTAKLCDEENIIFVLVGKGVEKERLIKRTKAEGVNNIYFLPPVEKDAVPTLVKEYDCSIMTGLESPLYRFGLCLNKMYDSMMAGIPIICSISSPNQTLVEEYNCGYQINSNRPEDIKKAIYKLSSMSDSDRKRIGENGKKIVLNRFTYRALARQFIDIINK